MFCLFGGVGFVVSGFGLGVPARNGEFGVWVKDLFFMFHRLVFGGSRDLGISNKGFRKGFYKGSTRFRALRVIGLNKLVSK